MDFLGLRNLDVMEITLDLIERVDRARAPTSTTSRSTTPRPSSCCSAGDTIGVFQLEGGPMRALLRSLAPDARSRTSPPSSRCTGPGPMAQNWHNEYADRKNGRKPVTYYHPDLEEILAPTYGLMIYQEQLMRVVAAARRATRSRRPTTSARRPARRSASSSRRSARSSSTAASRNGPRPRVRRADVRHDRAVRRLLVQQVAHASATATSRTRPRT